MLDSHTQVSPLELESLLCFCDRLKLVKKKKWDFFPIQRRMVRILGKQWSLIDGRGLIGRGQGSEVFTVGFIRYEQKHALCDCCHEQVISPLFFLQTVLP